MASFFSFVYRQIFKRDKICAQFVHKFQFCTGLFLGCIVQAICDARVLWVFARKFNPRTNGGLISALRTRS